MFVGFNKCRWSRARTDGAALELTDQSSIARTKFAAERRNYNDVHAGCQF